MEDLNSLTYYILGTNSDIKLLPSCTVVSFLEASSKPQLERECHTSLDLQSDTTRHSLCYEPPLPTASVSTRTLWCRDWKQQSRRDYRNVHHLFMTPFPALPIPETLHIIHFITSKSTGIRSFHSTTYDKCSEWVVWIDWCLTFLPQATFLIKILHPTCFPGGSTFLKGWKVHGGWFLGGNRIQT